MWEILQEKVYKTRITDMELSMTPLTNGCRNDDMDPQGQYWAGRAPPSNNGNYQYGRR